MQKNPLIPNVRGATRIPPFGGRCCRSTMTGTAREVSMLDALKNVADGEPPFPNCPFHCDQVLDGAEDAARLLRAASWSMKGIVAMVVHDGKVTLAETIFGRGLFALASAGIVSVSFGDDGTVSVECETYSRPVGFDRAKAAELTKAVQSFATTAMNHWGPGVKLAP